MSRSHLKILLYLAAVLLLGAVLAPPLYWGGKWLANLLVSFKQTNTPVIGWIAQKLTTHQFGSYYSRAFLISALGLLWPFLKWMRLSREKMGLEKNPQRTRDAMAGFLMSAGFLAVLMGGLLVWHAYEMEESVKWGGVITRAVLSGIGAALLEEWVFRGIFLGVALQSSRRWIAIILVSGLFSILHLMKPPDILVHDPQQRKVVDAVLKTRNWTSIVEAQRRDPRAGDWLIDAEYRQFAPSRIHWGSGLEMTGIIFKKQANPTEFFSVFLTLFAIGVILARARCATRSLWLPIGLHGGWIFANTLCLAMTRESAALAKGGYQLAVGGTRIPWIGTELRIGLAPLVTLLVTAGAVEWWIRKGRKGHAGA